MGKQKDMQSVMEFNGIIRNYIKMKRIESKIELNEEIKLGSRIFKPIKVLLEKENLYRIFDVEITGSDGVVRHKEFHELHLIELKKKSKWK